MPLNTIAPISIAELADVVAGSKLVLPHGARTKPALSVLDAPGATRVDLTGLCGITDYQPSEFVISVLAGTPLTELRSTLAEHGHYLPFDPPLAAAGATVGGTVAAGLNGPCRLRYGGVRDFVIGARFIDGSGDEIKTGGKVIKNVAGFDFGKLLVGSFGRLAAIAELTFKVFPAPESYLSVCFELGHIEASIAAAETLAGTALEPYAIDIEPPGRLHLRLGGTSSALSATAARAEKMIDAPATRTSDDSEPAYWDEVRDHTWAKGDILVKVPTTSRELSDLDFAFGRIDARRRYSLAGNVAHAALSAKQLPGMDTELDKLGLCGLVLWGNVTSARIGRRPSAEAEAAIKEALDPSYKFLPLP